MKGRIFIAWSGNNTLAQEVKQRLDTEQYTGIVGGQDGAANGFFVGQAVLEEINQCNQAIFVIEKKADGTISNNLMFELGYALAKFKHNKLHLFYIDIEEKEIPSDIRGAWATHAISETSENVAEEIVEKFLAGQKHIIPEDKMAVINDYYDTKKMILEYAGSPRCSEYELAQYVLFFSQAAYMFHNEKEGFDCLELLTKSLRSPSPELGTAISVGMCYLRMLLAIRKGENVLYLQKEDYREAVNRLKEIEEDTRGWQKDDFTRWLRVIVLDAINYASILHSMCPELAEKKRNRILDGSIAPATECLSICEELLKHSANVHFVELYMAYMYRNRATAQKALDHPTEEIRKNLELSYRMRRKLWNYYNEAKRINTRLLETFEMEYYLAMSEQLEYMEDLYDREDTRDDCEGYILRVKEMNREKSHFIHKIEINISCTDV